MLKSVKEERPKIIVMGGCKKYSLQKTYLLPITNFWVVRKNIWHPKKNKLKFDET
jgi:hypothetical protein